MITNKVADSGLITFDIETLIPNADDILSFDIAPFLFKGLILREKEFRQALAEYDFSPYAHKIVAVHCSADALIPMWSYMLIMTYLHAVEAEAYIGTVNEVIKSVTIKRIQNIDITPFIEGKVVIKGCGKSEPQADYYLHISQVLLPHVKSLMYGEPCSTVPIYKRKKLVK